MYSNANYYYKSVNKSRSSSLSNLSDDFLNEEISKDDPMYDFKEAAKKVMMSAPYCKCVMANIKTEEVYAASSDVGEMIYSYQKTEQRFQVFVKYDGHEKTYTVKGYDKDGNPFEKDIDPNDVDPEYADFPEFSALCMYFEQSETTAGFLADDSFDSDDILEKMNYLEKVNELRNEDGSEEKEEVADYAKKLFRKLRLMFYSTEDLAKELKEDKDWREMTDDEWDDLLGGMDQYIEAYKERIKQLREMQEEAIQKAAMSASSDIKTEAAASAAMNVAAGASPDGGSTESGEDESDWTKNLKTDDKVILNEAKAAQETETKAMSKYEEVMLTHKTTVGTTKTDGVTESASVEDDENGNAVWIITAYTEDGIISKKMQDGKVISSWSMEYSNPGDAKRVWDFLASFDENADLKFAGSKEFWERFLSDNLDGNQLFAAHREAFDKAAPNAPAKVKKAWMDAARETGYLEGGMMKHISPLVVRQATNTMKGINNPQNVFGDSVESALQTAKELLYDLENPLEPYNNQSESVRMYKEQEKDFYRKFIEKLEQL